MPVWEWGCRECREQGCGTELAREGGCRGWGVVGEESREQGRGMEQESREQGSMELELGMEPGSMGQGRVDILDQ